MSSDRPKKTVKNLTLSKSEYARRIGVSPSAIERAITSGRISTTPDGRIDPDVADMEWVSNTVNSKPGRKKAGEPVKKSGTTTLIEARTAHEILKVKIKEIELAEKKKEVIKVKEVKELFFKLARQERDAWLNWPTRITPVLAAKLNIDEHKLYLEIEAAVQKQLEELGDLHIDI